MVAGSQESGGFLPSFLPFSNFIAFSYIAATRSTVHY
jgi:hypothetical protein